MNFDQRRQWIDNLRRIPLNAVLRATGAEPAPRDPSKWRTVQGILSVNGAKFINWNHGKGGGGAIDLAMHLENMDFNTAVQWLDRCFPSTPLSATPATPFKPKLVLPVPDNGNLERVKQYLTEQRRLQKTLVADLIQAGRIYADGRANAVFLLLGKENRPVGAELRGTHASSWRGLAPGSRKDLGYFAIGDTRTHAAILCESAIDAISCAAFYKDMLCISTAGARPNPAWLIPLLAQGWRIHCGFDADTTGDRMAQAMITLHPAIQRLRPTRHDWNDTLVATI